MPQSQILKGLKVSADQAKYCDLSYLFFEMANERQNKTKSKSTPDFTMA